MNAKALWTSLLTLTLAASAHAAPGPGSYYLRGFVGYATQSLGDLNDDIEGNASDLRDFATFLDWDEHGAVMPFGVEVGIQVSDVVSAGVGFSYQSSESERLASLDFTVGTTDYLADIGEDEDLSLAVLYTTLALWAPTAPGLHVGAEIGVARGKYELSDFVDIVGSDGTFLVGDGSGEADATGFAVGVYAGYEVGLSSGFGISGRVGYRYCNLGELEGDYAFVGSDESGPVFDASSGPVTDRFGEPIDFDFSGIRAEAAVTLRFGGMP